MMKGVAAAVIAILLIVGATAYYQEKKSQAREEFQTTCQNYQEETQKYLLALSTRDASVCQGLDLQERCEAVIARDASLCSQDDLDCKAIASQNVTLCHEPLCRAQITQDMSHCQNVKDPQWCENFAKRNHEAFRGGERCKEAARTITSKRFWL